MYGATIGKTGVLKISACTNQACSVLADPLPDTNAAFVQAVVRVAKPHLLQQAYGGGQPNINSMMVRSLRVPFPQRAEQDKILEYVDAATNPIVSAVARAEREIDLIREYRTRLISDVVTGNVDVRGIPVEQVEEIAEPAEALLEEGEELEENEGTDTENQ
jgi:restriction endonuclease S subunit